MSSPHLRIHNQLLHLQCNHIYKLEYYLFYFTYSNLIEIKILQRKLLISFNFFGRFESFLLSSFFYIGKTLLQDESGMTNDDVRLHQGFCKIRLMHFRIKAGWNLLKLRFLVEIFQRGSFLIQTVKATYRTTRFDNEVLP